MPSLSSQFACLMVKYVMAPPYKRAGTSISEWRKLGQPYVFQATAAFVPEARQSLEEIGQFAGSHAG